LFLSLRREIRTQTGREPKEDVMIRSFVVSLEDVAKIFQQFNEVEVVETETPGQFRVIVEGE